MARTAWWPRQGDYRYIPWPTPDEWNAITVTSTSSTRRTALAEALKAEIPGVADKSRASYRTAVRRYREYRETVDRSGDARPSCVPVQCGTVMATAWCVNPAAAGRLRQVRRHRRARPEPGADRTATARRCGAIIPTASRGTIARISGAWTATTTAGPANGKVDGVAGPPGRSAAVRRGWVLRPVGGATGAGC